MKRFWDVAQSVAEGECWSVRLDGKPVNIPGAGRLVLPTAALADAVAAEWQAAGGAKGGETSYEHLKLTRLAGTWQERVAPDPEPTALAVARYGESDLLCYRATTPDALVLRERAAWDPWLDWLDRRHGVRLAVASGVRHVPQDAAALATLAAAVAAQPGTVLAALGVAVPALGSAVLGLAMAEAALSAEAAYDVSVVDEVFQAELWGVDAEAADRAARLRADILLAGRFMALTRA